MKYKKALFFILICITVSDALLYIAMAGFGESFFTPVLSAARFVALAYMLFIASKSSWKHDLPEIGFTTFQVYLFFNIITIIRGMLFAEDYWDWKTVLLNSLFFLLIPFAFFVGKNINYARVTIYYALNYLLLYGFLFIPLTFATNEELYSRLMLPASVLLVFVPYLKPKHQILVIGVVTLSILICIGFRSNVIKTVFALAVLSTYYVRKFVHVFWFKLALFVLFLIPLIFVYLGVSGQYNVFAQSSEKAAAEYQSTAETDRALVADTRTFLYVEVFATLEKREHWLMGEGGSGKYESDYFDYLGDGRGRYHTEVGILNVLLYSGIVGVFLYMMVLFVTAYYAIYRSHSWFCKMLGLIIAFRWILCFIEEFTQFDLNFYFLWIIIGLVSTPKFRALNDQQVRACFTF